MDDKTELAMLMQRIAGSIEGLEKSAAEIRDVLQVMRDRAEAELRQRVSQLNAMTATQKFTAGRWTRRDGDGIANLPPRTTPAPEPEPAKNGDRPTGDL